MIHLKDEICGERLDFYIAESSSDAKRICRVVSKRVVWALDTESTGVNPYARGWEFRTFQFGDARRSFVVPAAFRNAIERIITTPGIQWLAYNGPHDIRSIDHFLGRRTGVECAGEVYIPCHYRDARPPDEGGTKLSLKEQSCLLVDRDAGKWERALKEEFKRILIPIEGEVYRSGPRKGTQKYRKATLAEGWALIDPWNPAYLAYAASDPVLTFWLWQRVRDYANRTRDIYAFDLSVQQACDRLQRRGICVDESYTRRLDTAFLKRAETLQEQAASFGCMNIFSGQQIADTLTRLGATLTKQTKGSTEDKIRWSTDDGVLRGLIDSGGPEVRAFIRCVLLAKQLLKRRESYTQGFLDGMDSEGRVHASIKSLGARTTRMSVSEPPLQQLPVKDRGNDE